MSWLNIRRIIVFIVLFGLIAFVGIRVHLSYYLAVAVAFFISYSIIALEKLLYRRTLREVAIYLATIISGCHSRFFYWLFNNSISSFQETRDQRVDIPDYQYSDNIPLCCLHFVTKG